MKQTNIVRKWLAQGSPIDEHGTPHDVKGYILTKYAQKHGMRTLVETGTCFGGMIDLVVNDFDLIHTIELQPDFYKTTKNRYSSISKVNFHLGDSGEKISEVISLLTEPAVFFLDAHYSGGDTARGLIDTPIVKEILTIMNDDKRHLIVIDDARLFGHKEYPDYPTYDEMVQLVNAHGYSLIHEGDELVVY